MANKDQYFQIDMGIPYKFTKILIQGREDADEWVTSLKLLYADNESSNWTTYVDKYGHDVSFFHTCMFVFVFYRSAS